MSLKNPVTPPGVDPENLRLVAQRLNHYATPGPKYVIKGIISDVTFTVILHDRSHLWRYFSRSLLLHFFCHTKQRLTIDLQGLAFIFRYQMDV